MGNSCTGGCCAGETDQYDIEVFLKRTKVYNRCDLSAAPIEIGENGFVSPRMRLALLQEDYSHIYDTAFAEANGDRVRKAQAWVRACLTRMHFKLYLKQQELQDELEPPKYFSKEESSETLQGNQVVDINKLRSG